MNAEEFDAENWIDYLAQALSRRAEEHESRLRKYLGLNPDIHILFGGREGDPHTFSPDDVRDHFSPMGRRWNWVTREVENHAAKTSASDCVRRILLSHPTLGGVAGSKIGHEEFWLQVLDRGRSTSLTDPECRTDGAGRRGIRRPLPGGGQRIGCASYSGRGNRGGWRTGRAGCRIRRGAVLRSDTEGEDRRRRWSGNRTVRAGEGFRGRESGRKARPTGCRSSRLALDRGNGQAVPMEAPIRPGTGFRG